MATVDQGEHRPLPKERVLIPPKDLTGNTPEVVTPAQFDGQPDAAGMGPVAPAAVDAPGVSLRNTQQSTGLQPAEPGGAESTRREGPDELGSAKLPRVEVPVRRAVVGVAPTRAKPADAAASPAEPGQGDQRARATTAESAAGQDLTSDQVVPVVGSDAPAQQQIAESPRATARNNGIAAANGTQSSEKQGAPRDAQGEDSFKKTAIRTGATVIVDREDLPQPTQDTFMIAEPKDKFRHGNGTSLSMKSHVVASDRSEEVAGVETISIKGFFTENSGFKPEAGSHGVGDGGTIFPPTAEGAAGDERGKKRTVGEIAESLPELYPQELASRLVNHAIEEAPVVNLRKPTSQFEEEDFSTLDDDADIDRRTFVHRPNRVYAITIEGLYGLMHDSFGEGEYDEDRLNDSVWHAEQQIDAASRMGEIDFLYALEFTKDRRGKLHASIRAIVGMKAPKLGWAAMSAFPDEQSLSQRDIQDIHALGYESVEDVGRRVEFYNATHEEKLPLPRSYQSEQASATERAEEKYPYRLKPEEQPEELEAYMAIFDNQLSIKRTVQSTTGRRADYVDEVVRDALVFAYQNWNKEDPERLSDRTGWVVGIARNALKWEHGKEIKIADNPEVVDKALSTAEAPEITVPQQDLTIANLAWVPHANVLAERLQGKSIADIARTLGIERNTVYRRLEFATTALREFVGDPVDVAEAKINEYISTGKNYTLADVVAAEKGDWNEHVPMEVQIAARMLRRASRAHGIEEKQMAENLGIHFSNMTIFGQGRKNVSIRLIIDAARAAGINEDAIKEIDTLRRRQDLLRFFGQPGMTFDQAIHAVRLEGGETQKEFGLGNGFYRSSVESSYETPGGEKPREIEKINSMLKRAGIDPMSKEGQIFKLIWSESEPLDVDEFAMNPEKKFKYLKDLWGIDQANMAKEMHFQEGTIFQKLKGYRRVTPQDLMAVAKKLGVEEGAPLWDVITSDKPVELTDEDRLSILRGPLLFKNHIDLALTTEFGLSSREQQFYDSMRERVINGDTTNNMVNIVVTRLLGEEGLDLSKSEFCKEVGITTETLRDLRVNDHIPGEITITKIMSDYGFFHPLTQLVLHQAERERSLSMEERELYKSIIEMRKNGELAGSILEHIMRTTGITIGSDVLGKKGSWSNIITGISIAQRKTMERIMTNLGYEPGNLIFDTLINWMGQEHREKMGSYAIHGI